MVSGMDKVASIITALTALVALVTALIVEWRKLSGIRGLVKEQHETMVTKVDELTAEMAKQEPKIPPDNGP